MLKGSCLCGSVGYEVKGQVKSFYHCHCQRCRKASGTGHASNIRVSDQECIAWIKGEELLTQFKVSQSERFFNNFCTRCGSPMPRVVSELDAVVIPAGSLDCDVLVGPEAHIFWESRASWSCLSAKLPAYEEYVSDTPIKT